MTFGMPSNMQSSGGCGALNMPTIFPAVHFYGSQFEVQNQPNSPAIFDSKLESFGLICNYANLMLFMSPDYLIYAFPLELIEHRGSRVLGSLFTASQTASERIWQGGGHVPLKSINSSIARATSGRSMESKRTIPFEAIYIFTEITIPMDFLSPERYIKTDSGVI